MNVTTPSPETLSPWWRHAVILTLIGGFTVLIWLATQSYSQAPPIPETVIGPTAETLFTRADIVAGQQVFLKYGLMDNGSIWGHAAYLGPDFSAAYLHHLVEDTRVFLTPPRADHASSPQAVTPAVAAGIPQLLKQNRYDAATQTLAFTEPEVTSFKRQLGIWRDYFSLPTHNRGLPTDYLTDEAELRQLTAFFAWTAWASVAPRPGSSASYTNNFPYDPEAGNTPTGDTLLWSALSLIALLGGIAAVLFMFGKFDFLGWKGASDHVHPQMITGELTPSQLATLKYFVLVTVLFLVQALLGGVTAHYRADPGGFYGIDVSALLPSHLARTWHLQLAVFWVATAYVAGGLLLAHAIGGHEPAGQVLGIHILFGALALVVGGSLLGELLGINQLLGGAWYWLGHQGWEYLELGRFWQMLLAAGLVLWMVLLFRAVAPARKQAESREMASLFLYAAVAIPVFYLPAMFFDGTSHFSVVDTWRFWIIHLWVEGFWNFVGAGIFGFLINLPIVSYFEVGTLLTTNHGHTAMMGVFGMLAMALTVFTLRQASSDTLWTRLERYIRVSFWGLNLGLALMSVSNLFPGGVLQLMDVLEHGYWHARSEAFLNQPLFLTLEWLRLPGDLVFIGLGVVPMVIAALWCYRALRPDRRPAQTPTI